MDVKWATRIVAILACVISPYASAVYESNNLLATQWLESQQNIDGSWGATENEKFILTIESVQALNSTGYRNNAYFQGLTWLENHSADNADYLSRRALILSNHGDDVSSTISYFENAQDTTQTGKNAWGLSSTYHQSPIDTALVLSSLEGLSTSANIQTAIDFLKSSQLTGAGWPVGLEATSDAFTTAIVVKSLTLLQATDPSVSTNIANGISQLSASVTTTSPEYLQAESAHAAVLANSTSVAQPWLDNLAATQTVNGSWSNEIFNTALIMQVFSAVDGTASGANQTLVDVPDSNLRAVINIQLGRNYMDNLSRNDLARLTILNANGFSINDLMGLEWAVNLTTADLQNNNIASTTPLDGLTNLTMVLLDGNPVAGNDSDEDIPTLPEWGLIILAALLLGSAIRRQRPGKFNSGQFNLNQSGQIQA